MLIIERWGGAAVTTFLGILDGLDKLHDVVPSRKLDVWTFSVPKKVSRYLDWLMQLNRPKWKLVVDDLYRAAWGVATDGLGSSMSGGVGVLHTWGGSAPWEPHYHFVILLCPVVVVRSAGGDGCSDVEWRETQATLPKSELCRRRKQWTVRAKEILARKVRAGDCFTLACKAPTFVVHRDALLMRGTAVKRIMYELRAPMKDLWKGLGADGLYRGSKDAPKGSSDARASRVVVEVRPPSGELSSHFERETVRYSCGENGKGRFRRVRWYGFLATNQKTRFLPSLGMERDAGAGDSGGRRVLNRRWYRCGVDHVRGELRLKSFAPDHDGRSAEIFVLVPFERVRWGRPLGVVGKRVSWRLSPDRGG